jgi:cyclopropane-fatty-acyl-phospholipid synthase
MPVLLTTAGEQGLPRWFATTFAYLRTIAAGAVEIRLPDGRAFRVDGQEPGPLGVLDVKHPDLFARVARDGELGFAEAYMDEWWDSPDLQGLLDVLLMSSSTVQRNRFGAGLVRAWEKFRFWMQGNSRAGSRRNIHYHYDLGNAFYRTWLDETMTYSSALYKGGNEDLARAQEAKYASICDHIGVRDNARLLEIGCGWGGFAEFAAKERGARVTGLTISREQHDFAKERIFRAGLSEKVDIQLRDYRDETGSYDGIASIEMFEAVGEKYWPVYFNTVSQRLKPGAKASLQIITIADNLFEGYRQSVDFIQKYIFPGGMLPSPSALNAEVAAAGLRRLGSIEFGASYSRTLRVWHAAFNAHWDEIRAMGFDERFRRMWNFYLTSCAACFKTGTTDVTQLSLQRPA